MYGTVPYMVRANASIPHVMRIIAFRIFFDFVTIFSSLPAIVTMLYCCPRSSAAARILRLSTTAAPTLLATAFLGATVPYIFLFTSDKIYFIDRCASWSPCRRRWCERKQAPEDRLAATERSLPLLRGQDSI